MEKCIRRPEKTFRGRGRGGDNKNRFPSQLEPMARSALSIFETTLEIVEESKEKVEKINSASLGMESALCPEFNHLLCQGCYRSFKKVPLPEYY